jgi:hypothetical protein
MTKYHKFVFEKKLVPRVVINENYDPRVQPLLLFHFQANNVRLS